MISQGSIISYIKMCDEEGVSLQRGMNFRIRGGMSIILMSSRKNAPYKDQVLEKGKVLIYEGHDIPSSPGGPLPKISDQVLKTASGRLTENGKFFKAASEYKEGRADSEIVKVYEKIRDGIWVYNGIFTLVDSWKIFEDNRNVYKFKLTIIEENAENKRTPPLEIEHNRLIPSQVKLAVWERDKGKCVECGRADSLHFDHIIPFSKGGSSSDENNIQLLCAKHNLSKHDKIQ